MNRNNPKILNFKCMQKIIFSVFILCCVAASCTKHPWPWPHDPCDPHDPQNTGVCTPSLVGSIVNTGSGSMGGSTQMEFDEQGRATKVTTIKYRMITSTGYDSVIWDISYPDNITAHVVATVIPLSNLDEDPYVVNYDYKFNDSGFVTSAIWNYDDPASQGNPPPTFVEYIYDNNNKLVSILSNGEDFSHIKYDDRGNITQFGGEKYEYGAKETTDAAYPSYRLEEILNWIPLKPKNVRIMHSVQTGFTDPDTNEELYYDYIFAEHKVDDKGRLTQFTTYQNSSDATLTAVIEVKYNCTDVEQ